MLHGLYLRFASTYFQFRSEAATLGPWQGATTSTARWRTPSTSWASAGRCSSSASCSRTTSSATRISMRGSTGCGTNILAARLKTLEQGGVVRRRQLDPPAASWVYELTEYGKGLREVLHVLAHWGARSLGPPAARGDLEPGWLAGRPPHRASREHTNGRIEFRIDGEVAAVVDRPDPERRHRGSRGRDRRRTGRASITSWSSAISAPSRSRETSRSCVRCSQRFRACSRPLLPL